MRHQVCKLAAVILAFGAAATNENDGRAIDEADTGWRTVGVVDEFDEPTRVSRAYARATFGEGHWCLLQIDHLEEGRAWRDGHFPARGRAGLRCDHFPFDDRAGGHVRARVAGKAPVSVWITPDSDGRGGWFGNYTAKGDTYESGGPYSKQRDFYHSFADEIFEAMYAESTATISITLPRSAGSGAIRLTFPVAGLAHALEDAGFDTRRYTQYESTWHHDDGSVTRNVFWLHESEVDELVKLRNANLKVRTTVAVRQPNR